MPALKTCKLCDASKPESEFAFRSCVKGTRYNFCKTCCAARAREYYALHRDAIRAIQNARQRQQRAEHIAARQGEPK